MHAMFMEVSRGRKDPVAIGNTEILVECHKIQIARDKQSSLETPGTKAAYGRQDNLRIERSGCCDTGKLPVQSTPKHNVGPLLSTPQLSIIPLVAHTIISSTSMQPLFFTCGPPNPRKAVFEAWLVRQSRPTTRTFGIL